MIILSANEGEIMDDYAFTTAALAARTDENDDLANHPDEIDLADYDAWMINR
jgi:hypothetical protein